MLAFIAEQYRSASEDEHLEMALHYGPVVLQLQQVVNKAAHRQRGSGCVSGRFVQPVVFSLLLEQD
jgi:hypothetical protein